jgi:hypothetical protein
MVPGCHQRLEVAATSLTRAASAAIRGFRSDAVPRFRQARRRRCRYRGTAASAPQPAFLLGFPASRLIARAWRHLAFGGGIAVVVRLSARRRAMLKTALVTQPPCQCASAAFGNLSSGYLQVVSTLASAPAKQIIHSGRHAPRR